MYALVVSAKDYDWKKVTCLEGDPITMLGSVCHEVMHIRDYTFILLENY